MHKFNEIQELHFALMEKVSHNDLDGEQVVRDLREHADLWISAVMWKDMCSEGCRHLDGDAFQLPWMRDLHLNDWNIDTLYIVPAPGSVSRLLRLVWTWRPDTVEELKTPSWGIRQLPKECFLVWWD